MKLDYFFIMIALAVMAIIFFNLVSNNHKEIAYIIENINVGICLLS